MIGMTKDEALKVLGIASSSDSEIISRASNGFRFSPVYYKWSTDEQEQAKQLKK